MLFMIQSDRKGLEVTPPSLWILINQGRTFKSLTKDEIQLGSLKKSITNDF